MRRLAFLGFGIIAALAAGPALAQSGGGGRGGGLPGDAGQGNRRPSDTLGGLPTDSTEATGQVFWIESGGQPAAIVTSVHDDPAAPAKAAEIDEVERARGELRPVLVCFHKPRDLMAIGPKATKDPEVDASESLEKSLWNLVCVAERSREFVCVRVNTASADTALLKKHGVSRAPAFLVLDADLKQVHFSASPSVSPQAFIKVLDSTREKAEKEIRRLAKLEGESPEILKARERLQELAQRDLYREGLKALDRFDWARAEAKFKEATGLQCESEWKSRAATALVETEAGRELQKAEALCKEKRYKEAEPILQRIVEQMKGARHFGPLASAKLDYVRRKLDK